MFNMQTERQRDREIISSFRNTAEAWTGFLPVHTYALVLINWAIDVITNLREVDLPGRLECVYQHVYNAHNVAEPEYDPDNDEEVVEEQLHRGLVTLSTLSD